MRIVSLFIPTYLPTPFPGATPMPMSRGRFDHFEREAAALSDFVTLQSCQRLLPDAAKRFATVQIMARYDFMVDPETDTIGQVAALALKAFGLESVTMLYHGQMETFDAAKAEEFIAGLHPWNPTEEE